MKALVTAALSAIPTGSSAPTEIIFIPEGSHKIRPLTHKEGIEVNLNPLNGAAVAAALDAQLQSNRARAVQPWLDFEHTKKAPASGYPTAFRYEPGKGIMAAVEWSGSGRKAIEDRDVRYFSPEFYIDSAGVPCGIPDKGPLGGLVSEPAFRNIGAIAAGQWIEQKDHEDEAAAYDRVVAAMEAEAEANAEAEETRLVASEKVRQDTYDKLEKLKELGLPEPWDQLFEASQRIAEKNPEMDTNEAFNQACQENPLIYQLWQDSLPTP